MKKIIIVSILVLALICSLSTIVKAEDTIDINDFTTIPDSTGTTTQTNTNVNTNADNSNTATNTNTNTTNTTANQQTDSSTAKTENPQTGVKEEAPIIIITLIGIGVAVYAGRKIKKYNY